LHRVILDAHLVADVGGEGAGPGEQALQDAAEQEAVEVETSLPIGLGKGQDLGQETVEADEVVGSLGFRMARP